MKTNHLHFPILLSFLLIFLVSCKKEEETKPVVTISHNTWSVVFSDDFQRADGSLGSNYSTQVAYGTGVASILNNKLAFIGSGYWAIRYETAVPKSKVRASTNFTVINGKPAFALSLKSQNLYNSNWVAQEFYSASIDSASISIVKYKNTSIDHPETGVMSTIVTKAFSFQKSHTYKLLFTSEDAVLTAYIEDLGTGIKDSIQGTDTGTVFTGSIVSFNGNSRNADNVTFDDFKIETGN